MKRIKTLLALVLCICLLAGLSSFVFADEYKYTVTVSGGLYGKDYGDVKMSYKSIWNPNDFPQKDNGIYYFKGYHISGQEDSRPVGAFEVEKDMILVATYGVKGKQVSYTVHYRDEAGKKLLDSRTLYGNEGDSPAIAFLYCEGYVPKTYNISGTLKADGKNEFVFVYQKLKTEQTAGTKTSSGAASTAAQAEAFAVSTLAASAYPAEAETYSETAVRNLTASTPEITEQNTVETISAFYPSAAGEIKTAAPGTAAVVSNVDAVPETVSAPLSERAGIEQADNPAPAAPNSVASVGGALQRLFAPVVIALALLGILAAAIVLIVRRRENGSYFD